jgi:hypothetical protein
MTALTAAWALSHGVVSAAGQKRVQVRGKERGMTLPDEPPAKGSAIGPGAGMGPGGGRNPY